MSSGLSTTDQQALEDSDTACNFDIRYPALNCPHACIIACLLRTFSGVSVEFVKYRVTQGKYNDNNSRLTRAGREPAQGEGSAYSFAIDLVP